MLEDREAYYKRQKQTRLIENTMFIAYTVVTMLSGALAWTFVLKALGRLT